MSCKCKEQKHQCTYTGCTNHVIKGQHTKRYLGVCQEHFDNLFNDPHMRTTSECQGYKYPNECPHKGKYDKSSLHCKECVKDADYAMKEAQKGPTPQ